MTPTAWFDDLPVLGQLPPGSAAAKLREAGEDEAATRLEEALPRGYGYPEWPMVAVSGPAVAAHRTCLGHLASAPPGTSPRPIQHAGNILPDLAVLQNACIKITLDRLRVAGYPGRGRTASCSTWGLGINGTI